MSKRIRTAIQTDFEAGPIRGRGKIRNVAEGGLFVDTTALPDQGDIVVLSFRGPQGALDVEGLVWWTTDDAPGRHRNPGFGMRLLQDTPAFERFFDSLS